MIGIVEPRFYQPPESPVVAEIEGEFEWDLRLNATGEATVTATDVVPGLIRPWEHTLTIFDEGLAVWRGPVVSVKQKPDGVVTIDARDPTSVLERRLNRGVPAYYYRDITELWLEYVNESGGISAQVTTTPLNVQMARVIEPYSEFVADSWRKLVERGLNWWVSYQPSGSYSALTTVHAGPLPTSPTVIVDLDQTEWEAEFSRDIVTEVVGIVNSGSSEVPPTRLRYSAGAAAVARWGLLELLVRGDSFREVDAAAETALASLAQSVVVVTCSMARDLWDPANGPGTRCRVSGELLTDLQCVLTKLKVTDRRVSLTLQVEPRESVHPLKVGL